MSSHLTSRETRPMRRVLWFSVSLATVLLIAVLALHGMTFTGSLNPTVRQTADPAAALDIAVLVFREGLECILVLAAITASMTGDQEAYQQPVAAGAGIGFIATLATWFLAVRLIDDIGQKISALDLQAGTGLLAIVVLLLVMNWFFHKMYWTGWISLHNQRKRDLMEREERSGSDRRVLLGLGLLGFSSFYREGVEVVLFLQSYRLKLGGEAVLYGVLLGLSFSLVVAILTFVVHRKLPYRKMLVLTGMMLGLVMFVMVGEQAQEMQLAHWLSVTPIPWLANKIPAWMGLWLSIFPTVETLSGQAIALVLVLGSYFVARQPSQGRRRKNALLNARRMSTQQE